MMRQDFLETTPYVCELMSYAKNKRLKSPKKSTKRYAKIVFCFNLYRTYEAKLVILDKWF